jgi:steroid delta-isomerase-like uncharacterized protein
MNTRLTNLADLSRIQTTRLSRRAVARSIGLGGGALAALAALGPASGLAAKETIAGEPPSFLASFFDAWATAAATGDASLVMPFYADDAVLEDVPLNLVYQGPAEIEPFLVDFFGNYSDASVTWQSVFSSGDWAAAEVLFEGKYTGQIPGLPAGDWQPLVTRSVHVYDLGEQAIARQSLYFDSYGFLIHLGVLPAPDA